LDTLPPKVLALSADGAIPLDQSSSSGEQVSATIASINAACFTGKGDRKMVVELYTSYAARIAQMLQSTLAVTTDTNATPSTVAFAAHTPETIVFLALAVPALWRDATPNRPDAHNNGDRAQRQVSAEASAAARRAGREGTYLLALAGDESTWEDACHVAIPWKRPSAEWMTGIKESLESLDRLREGVVALHNVDPQQDLGLFVGRTTELGAHRQPQCSEARARETLASRSLVFETRAAVRMASAVGQPFAEALQPIVTRLGTFQSSSETSEVFSRTKSADILSSCSAELNTLPTDVFRRSGAAGVRCFGPGQLLAVRGERGWVDAEVVSSEADGVHVLRPDDGGETITVALHPWNHAPRELTAADFEAERTAHVQQMRERHAHLTDPLTGRRLHVQTECVWTRMQTSDSVVEDARTLTAHLHSQHAQRLRGEETAEPPCILLTAGPACGKTSLVSQVIMCSLDEFDKGQTELLPIVVKLQLLQRQLQQAPSTFEDASNWVDASLRIEYAAQPHRYRMLRQAMMARRALLLLDGVDEGGLERERIERHIVEVLAPQGHVLVVTSRPAGLTEQSFVAKKGSMPPGSKDRPCCACASGPPPYVRGLTRR
jgi:hypothetical protein